MKYFTLKWWAGKLRDPMAVREKYSRYIESVRASLPADLQRLCGEVTLHDAHLRRLHFADGTLELHLDGERWEKERCFSGRRFRLTYRGVRSLTSSADPKAGLGGPHGYGDLGYEEIEVIAPGPYEHRILFSSGIELQVRFAGFSLWYEDEAA